MGKQRPIDLSAFDEVVKSKSSTKIDLSAFDDVVKPKSVEKKNLIQPVAPTGSKPSKTGFEPFQTQVDTSTPSVILSDEQKLRQEQERIGKRFETTLLDVPTEFGKVANFMDAAKKVKDTLPQAPEFRRYGEIPKMQPTEMTEGQRLGESLTKGTDVRELITDKLTGKKTGLQKQIEAAQEAFRQSQGGELVGEIQGAQQLKNMYPESVETERERKGNYAKFLYNQFLSGTGSAASGLIDFALAIDKSSLSASPISKSGFILDYYRKNNAKGVRNFLKDNIGFEVDKGLEAKYNEGMLTGAIGGLASSAPAMITAVPTMGGSLFAQMYDGALQSIEAQPDSDKWDNDTKTIYAGSLGLIQAGLEKYGLDKILKGGSGQLTDAVFRKILKSAEGRNITGHVLENLIDENVKGVARIFAKGGVRAVDAFVTEFFTGSGQETAAIGSEIIFDKATGKPIFNTANKTDWIGFVERIAKAGTQEGIGGFVLGGGVGMLSGLSKKKVKESQAVINEIDRQLDNPNTQPEVVEVLLQRKADTQANIDDVVDLEADVQSKMSPDELTKSQELSKQIDKIDLALQDPNTGESVKADLEFQKEAIEKEIDEILRKVTAVPQPKIETREDIIKEIRAAESEMERTGDFADYKIKIDDLNARLENLVPVPEDAEIGKPKEVAEEVEIKNEGKANAPTKESVTERLNINNPFYKKVEDALFKLGLIEKYNPETKTGDIIGGYVESDGAGGFASGDMYFKADGSISYVTEKGIVSFDKNGNVISENTKQVAQEAKKIEIEGAKSSITSLEKTRDSEAFKYKEVTETDILGNKKKVKRLKTTQELKESTDKINDAIDKAKATLIELEKSESPLSEEVVSEDIEAKEDNVEKKKQEQLENKVKELESQRKNLRSEDGTVAAEKMPEFNRLGKELNEAKRAATRGNSKNSILIKRKGEGEGEKSDPVFLSKEEKEEAADLIEQVIQNSNTVEEVVKKVNKLGYVFDIANANLFAIYLSDRYNSNAPQVGNNKSSFQDWVNGKQLTTQEQQTKPKEAVSEDVEAKKADIEKRRQEELDTVIQTTPIEVLDEEGNVISTSDKKVKINAKYDAELAALDQTKPKEDAIQEQAAGQVPVQPEAPVSKEVEQGKPEAKPEVVTEKGKEVGSGIVADVDNIKNKQLEIINKTNPAPNNYNTWIRKVEDIKTADEAFKVAKEEGAMYPDFTEEQMQEALDSGEVTVYSSMPIKDGVFVSPSKMNAQEYAGGKGGKLYSKKVKLDDVAWIDEGEGQYASVSVKEQTPAQQVEQLRADEQVSEAVDYKGKKISDVKIGDVYYDHYAGAIRKFERLPNRKKENGEEVYSSKVVDENIFSEGSPNDVIEFNESDYLKSRPAETFLESAEDLFYKNPFLGYSEVFGNDGKQVGWVALNKVDNNTVDVDNVVSMTGGKREGGGSQIMKMVTKNADRAGVTLTLVPEPLPRRAKEGFDTPEKLQAFYEKFGFVKDKKKPTMTRKPQPVIPQTVNEQIAELRIKEQVELKKSITNAEQYLTDGKVDRDKITDAKDLKKFDEIYDKYDKLITPLLPEKETAAPKEAPAKAKAAPKLTSKVDTKLKIKALSDLDNKIKSEKGRAKKSKLEADKLRLIEKNPSIGYVYDNLKNVLDQLVEKGLISSDGKKVVYEGKSYATNDFTSVLHDGLLDQMVKDGIVDDSRFKKMAEQVERTEFDSEEDAELYAISRETDPNVIAAKYFELPTAEDTNFKDYQIMQYIGKIKEKDWAEYNDLNNLTPELRRRYIDSTNKKASGLDVQAQELQEQLGIAIDPSDFIDVILEYKDLDGFKIKSRSNVEQALLERYNQLTGKNKITDATAKKAFETVNKGRESERKAFVSKEKLEEIGVTEEDIARQKEFEETGFGELETPLEEFEYQKKQVSTKGKSKIEIAREIRLKAKEALDKDRKRFGIAFDSKNRAKVLFNYHKALVNEALAYIEVGVKSVEDFAKEIEEAVTKEVRDAWNEANGRIKKKLSDFIPIAEKEQKEIEKENLRKEDLGLVAPKLEDYESRESGSVSQDFESLAYQPITSDEFRDTLSNKERESGNTLTRAEKRYQVNPLMAAFELGENIVAKAKEEFGDTYVNDLLAYVAKNQNTLGVDKASLILLTLENDLNRQKLSDPDNLTLAKQEKMVQNLAIPYQRSAARAIGYGRLRRIARVGYDVDEVTSQLFSSEQVERRRKVEKAMESTADDINNEAELQEQETEGKLVIEEPKVKRDAKQVKADIKAVIAQMKADLVKSARGAGGALSKLPFQDQVEAITPHVIKLSKLFAELGGMKAKEIVAEIRKSIKDIAPDVKESDIVDILKSQQKSPKNTKDRLEQAKDRVKARIEELQQEIADKRKELKIVNKVKSDAELDDLLEQEKALKDIAKQYLTQDSIDRINESKEKAIVTKLENEIASLDEQIANQQKAQKQSRAPVTSLEITLLRAQRKAKMDVLNDLDPNPKAFTKQALIDAGYGREITVTTKQGKEKRQVLDWKKLAGKEMDVTAIQNIVEQALKDKGFTPAQISRMQYAFVQEFTNLRASVIDKSLKTLKQMNEPKKASERKSSARRLAELFDLGLFDQKSDEFDYLINKAIGLSDIGQEAFFEAKKLSESLKEIYSMNSNEFFTRQFIREINLKVSKLLNKVAFHEGNNWYRVTNVVAELMNLGLRTKLQTLKQFFDNQISGRQERLIQDIGTMFQKGTDTKELKKLRSKYASLIKDDITKNAGLYFGEVNSPFLTKSQIEDYINSRTDNQFYHLVVSSMLGKSYLEGADSMNKAASTERFFISMLLKTMTDKSNPNRMTPEDALQFVNEQLTGQKFEDALKESAKIINQINTKAGKVVLAETKQNIFRGAMDLVKGNLLVGQALDANSIESAYNAAYTVAGYGLGHEANNIVSETVNQRQGRLEEKIKKAVKEKEWSRAANLTIIATLNRNIINPFVGGGTNWLVLGLQKSGLDIISPLHYMAFKMKNGIDLSTDAGVKKLEETLVADYRSKTINKRFLIGGVSASLLTLAVFATGGDDEMEEWLKKNEWARKYQSVFVPQLTLLAMSIKDKTFGDWATETFSKSTKFEKLPKIVKGIEAYNKGGSPEADKAKLYGVMGNVAGSFVDVPLAPVRFLRDLGGVYNAIADKPQEKPDFKNVGFANGFFNYGLIDYFGFRPDRTYMRDMEEYIPESDVKTIKFLREKDLEINSNSDKAVLSNGIKKSLTEEEAQKYDMSFGEEAYRIMKEAINKYDDITEDQLKSLKKTAEFMATEKAQSELGVEDASLQQLEIDGVKYALTEGQIKKRKFFIREYIKENRQGKKFAQRYREAVKDGKILNMPESKRRMLMESAEASATRKIKELFENKTSLLEVAPK